MICHNCEKKGHKKDDCWAKGGGKEGQGSRQKGKKKSEKANKVAVVASDKDDGLITFSCTSDYGEVANALKIPKSKMGGCIDSGVSRDYSPDCEKFSKYRSDCDITTADGQIIKAIGMGDLHIDLPNGSKRTAFVFKDAVHSPNLAFTLISVRRLDMAGYTVTFGKGCAKLQTNLDVPWLLYPMQKVYTGLRPQRRLTTPISHPQKFPSMKPIVNLAIYQLMP